MRLLWATAAASRGSSYALSSLGCSGGYGPKPNKITDPIGTRRPGAPTRDAVVYGAGVRFELDWRDRNIGSMQTPRRFLDFIVDGQSLYERHGSDFISPLGWLPEDHDERAARRLLREEAPDIEGRVAVYICPECGDLDCGALTALITRERDDIIWRDVSITSLFDGTWSHEPIRGWEELRFPAGDYWRVITERPRTTELIP